ncbi:MAG: ATP-dependent helicase [Treponema sp.]|nr:ATP-dependent helicase [Treponema sp.]
MNSENYPSYLEPLNSEQRRAVLHTGKPLLILAGAGSGKTRVITTKIAYLIREKGIDPRSILAVTFTNKAAKEMAERARQIEERAGEAMLRTFHSFGAWFLRRNCNLAGLGSNFTIYDEDDTVSLLCTLLENSPKSEAKQWAYSISRAKDYFLGPDDPQLSIINHHKKFRSIYKRYEERLSQTGNADFGDLIKKPVEILRNHPEVAQRFRDRFSVIMVDEYQDANIAQFQLLKELSGAETYVCVVGDDDQSIYRFRGAEVKNILEFPERFSGADIIRLEQNYRSTAPILKAASSVVDCNNDRLGKTLCAEKGDGVLPLLNYLSDQQAEVSYCADLIKTSVKKKKGLWSDWAILYRTNAQSAGFETAFLRGGIPYRVVGSLKFYEREEIKDSLALLSFLVNPCDEVAFRRIVNKPTRGIGDISIDKIVDAAIADNNNLIKAGCKPELEISKKARKGLNEFYSALKNAKTLLNSPGKGLSEFIEKLLIDSGIAGYHKAQDEISGNSKMNNLQEFLNGAGIYENTDEGLLMFLEDIELDRSLYDEADKRSDIHNSVTLITFHNTKGLEFKKVIMTGLEQGIFPREDKKDDDLEEERRLFYVGATRAMDELYFTSCKERRLYGKITQSQPSLFLNEIDKSCLQVVTEEIHKGHGVHLGYRQHSKPSFNPLSLQNLVTPVSEKNKELEERAGWKRGQRLFNDNHGHGSVIEVKDSDDGPIVRVRFDSGYEKRFLSEIQGRAYEKIEDN